MKVSLAVQRGLKYVPKILSAILLFEMEGEENKFCLLYLALKITEKRKLLSRVDVLHTH